MCGENSHKEIKVRLGWSSALVTNSFPVEPSWQPFSSSSSTCVHVVCMHEQIIFTCVGVSSHANMFTWRPKFGVSCLPEWISILYFKAGSLTGAPCFLENLASLLQEFHVSASSAVITGDCHTHPAFYVGSKDLNSRLHACTERFFVC